MFETHATLLLAAILVPLLAGIALSFGSGFSTGSRRALALVGFGVPLLASLLLAFRFDPALVGGYKFESKFATGLESIGIYVHLGLNGISLPLFLLAGVVGFAAGLYAMFSNAERPHLYLALMLFMQGGLICPFASVAILFFYFLHAFALIPTFIMIAVSVVTARRIAAMEMTYYLTLVAMRSLPVLIALYVTSGAETFSLP